MPQIAHIISTLTLASGALVSSYAGPTFAAGSSPATASASATEADPKPVEPSSSEAKGRARRGRWYGGFALGSGAASTSVGGESTSWSSTFEGTDATRLSVDFELGFTLTPQLLLGVRGFGMREATEIEGVTVALGQTHYLANLTYFPLPSGEGPFLRAGAGLARISLSMENKASRVEDSQAGLGATAGLGYAFWLGQSFNLTLSNDFSMASFASAEDKTKVSSGWFDAVQVGCMWY